MNRRIAIAAVVLYLLLGSTGETLGGGTVYDFSTGSGVDRFAFGNAVAEIPIPPALNGVPSTPFSVADYAAVAASDDARHDTGIIEGGGVRQRGLSTRHTARLQRRRALHHRLVQRSHRFL